MRVETKAVEQDEKRLSIGGVLGTAAAFGLATGLLEGGGLLLFRGFGWGNSRIPEGVSPSIVWTSAAVNLGLFLILGVVVWLLQRAVRRLWVLRAMLLVFSFLLFVDLLGVSGRIGPLGMIIFAAGLASFAGRWLYERWGEVSRRAPLVSAVLAVIAVALFLGIEGRARSRESAAVQQLPEAAQGTPNVIVVVVDTLRADHMSSYGYSRHTTPYLEHMAQEGVQFEDAISPSSWTLPAHQSLLSGRYPHEHGQVREQMVNQSLPSLGRTLASKGYRTGAFSANTDFFCRRAGFAEGFQHFEDYFYSAGDMVYRTFWGRLFFRTYVAELLGLDELPGRKKAADVNGETLRWISRDSRRPFFAFLNYFDVHYPYVPEQPYRSKFADARQQEACRPSWAFRLNPLHRPTEFERLMQMSPACFQVQVDQYDGGVVYVDQQIANLMSELQRAGLDRNTIVVVTSDHGESFREHGLVTHGTSLYRELIHVPLLVWWPGHVPAGEKISRPVSTASLPATILDLLDSDAHTDYPIPSLATLWKQPSAESSWPDPVSEMAQDIYIPPQYPAYKGWLKSITDSQWHLIVAEHDGSELYDWPDDVAETRNLVESAQGKTVAAEINMKLWNQVNPSGHTKADFDPPTKSNQLAKAGQ
jgi:arylsulfatase A-like enzyme